MAKKKPYQVITPEGKTISVEEYMNTDDYNKKIEQQIDDFLTNKKEKELIALFSPKKQSKKKK